MTTASAALQSGRAADCLSIAALAADPDRAVEVPVNQIAALLASLASKQARLVAIQGVLVTRMIACQSAVRDDLPIGY